MASTNEGLTGPLTVPSGSAILNGTTLATVDAPAGTDASVPDIALWSCLRNCDLSPGFLHLRLGPYVTDSQNLGERAERSGPDFIYPPRNDFELFAPSFWPKFDASVIRNALDSLS
jgi:hypothetical protein